MNVEWIKLTTDMFNHQKIKYIRTLPEGNNLVLIWVMLLTMAGRCNSNGMIFLTENIPYTTKILADELDFDESVITLALRVFCELDMIVMDSDIFAIVGWEEYQNTDGMNKIKEQNKLRQARWREKQKALITTEETEEEKPTSDWWLKAQEIWEMTFAVYPKKVAEEKARIEWEKIVNSAMDDEHRLELTRVIYKAIMKYVTDYQQNNSEDTTFKYVPRFDNWLKDHLPVWEKKVRGEG